MELAINHLDGCVAGTRLVRPPIAAPIGSNQIQLSVAVEISGTDAIPKTAPSPQPRLGGRIDPAASVIAEEAQGVPVAREHKIRVSVAIDIGEDGATGSHLVCHELGLAPTVRPTGKDHRPRGFRIASGAGAGPDQ